MANTLKIEAATIKDIMRQHHPTTVATLVEAVQDKIGSGVKETLSLVRGMVQDGQLKIRFPITPLNWLDNFLAKHRFMRNALHVIRQEQLVKSMGVVVFINVLSWFIITMFMTSSVLLPVRFVILGLDFLFLPGFSLTIAWYPFTSPVLDFRKLDREKKRSGGKVSLDEKPLKQLDLVTRIGYATCYSICLLVLIGFLLGVGGLGFSIIIMHACFTIIEILVLLSLIVNIKRILDPYLYL
jgi:hypothetical protein